MHPDPIAEMQSDKEELADSRRKIRIFEERLAEIARDNRSLEKLVKEKNSRILTIEAENIRLRMLRTDESLRSDVTGLRTEVGKKDRELTELRRVIERLTENEKSLLGRTAAAEQRAATFQSTAVLIQAARDAADEKLEAAEEARLEAVRKMVDAVSKREGLEKRVVDLLGIISSVTKVLPLLPPALVKPSKDVQSLLATLKKVDVRV